MGHFVLFKTKNIFAITLLAATFLVSCHGADETAVDIYKRCNDNQAVCVGINKITDCWSPDSGDCEAMVTIQPNPDKSKMMFTLFASKSGPPTKYLGVGIAVDGTGMKDASIVLCRSDGVLNAYWTTGPYLDSPVGDGKKVPDYISGFTKVSEGIFICNFELNSTYTESMSGTVFELAKKNYAILLAVGTVEDGTPIHHSSKYRVSPISLIVPSKQSLKQPADPEDKGKTPGNCTSSNLLTVYLYFAVLSLLVVNIWFG